MVKNRDMNLIGEQTVKISACKNFSTLQTFTSPSNMQEAIEKPVTPQQQAEWEAQERIGR